VGEEALKVSLILRLWVDGDFTLRPNAAKQKRAGSGKACCTNELLGQLEEDGRTIESIDRSAFIESTNQ
jgi:hypothetical protein